MRNEGFTLLEVTFTLSIVSLCVFFFSLAVTQIKTVRGAVKDDRQIEWHLFINQMENDLIGTEFKDVTELALSVSKYSEKSQRTETLIYQIRRDEIARRMAGGYEPILTEIDSAEFGERTEESIQLTVLFKNGETFTSHIRVNESVP